MLIALLTPTNFTKPGGYSGDVIKNYNVDRNRSF